MTAILRHASLLPFTCLGIISVQIVRWGKNEPSPQRRQGDRLTTRRRLLRALAAIPIAALSPATHGQTHHRISILSAGSRATYSYLFAAFEAGLRDLGYIPGKN